MEINRSEVVEGQERCSPLRQHEGVQTENSRGCPWICRSQEEEEEAGESRRQVGLAGDHICQAEEDLAQKKVPEGEGGRWTPR